MKKITLLIFALLLSMAGFAQAFQESFEGDVPPDPDWNLGTTGLDSNGHWAIFDNGTGPIQSWTVNAAVTEPITVCDGTKSAYINRENIWGGGTVGTDTYTSQDFLATPLITIPTNGEMRFLTRTTISGDQLTKYKIMWAPASAAQNNPAAYILLQEFTEVNLTATFNVCEEKIISLNAQSGQQGYIAFVREYTQSAEGLNGDRWLVDNVRVDVACTVPTLLTAGLISQNSAQLDWTIGTGQTSWEIAIVAFEDPFPATGTIIGTRPYNATTTLPAGAPFTITTQYKYRVRAVCSSGFISAWSAPFSFTTSSPGLNCTAPIVVGTLPYCTTDNTANYGDSTDVQQPSGCAQTGANYMSGNDVFYSYTPTVTGAVSIALTPTGNWSGIFVYDGCVNVGVNCVAGVANEGGGIREIPSLLVEAGHQYIIVISTRNAPQTIPYTLCIQQLNCAPPNALSAVSTGPTSANISWGNLGGASSWEVFVQAPGGTIPTTAGITVNTTTYSVTELNNGTELVLGCYQYWVRAACGDGTFSPWAGPYQFCTTTCTSGCNYSLVMTDSFGDGWNGNTMTLTQGATSTTIGATFTDDFGPITIPVTLCDGSFTLNWNTGGAFAGEVGIAIVNNFGQTIYYHAPGTNQQGQLLYTGTVDCANPSCLPPTAITATTPTTDGASVSWTPAPGPAPTSWEIYVVPTGQPAPDASSIPTFFSPSGPPLTLTGLLADTPYTVWVRAVCSTAGPNPWSSVTATFTTLPTCPKPINLAAASITVAQASISWSPGAVETGWQIIVVANGAAVPAANDPGWQAATSPFIITGLNAGTEYDVYVRAVCSPTDSSTPAGPLDVATPPGCGGVFVDNGGSSANYANGSNSVVTICPNNVGDVVTVTFTTFNTETNWDGLYVFDGNSTSAEQIASTNPGGNVPGGLPGSYWGTTIPGPFTSTSPDGCLTFWFRSDGSVNNPGWTANITCTPGPTCPKPNQLVATSINSTTQQLTWTNNSTATQFEVLALLCGSPEPTAATTGILTTATTHIFTGLIPGTCYDFYVRAICSDTDLSAWSSPRTVTTALGCGGLFTDSGGANANYGNTENNTWTICPDNPGEAVTVTFTSFDTETNWDGLYVFDGNTTAAPLIPSTNGAGNVPGGVPGSYWGTTIPGPFTSSNANGCLTFQFRSDGSGIRAGWIGSITCGPAPTCLKPVTLTAEFISQTSALLGWTQPVVTGNDPPTQWEVIILPTGSTPPLPSATGTIVGVNPVLITNLTPGTQYTFYVRALCGDSTSTLWSNGFNFVTLPSNDECTGAIMVPVNSNSSCNQSVTGTVSGATASTQPNSCPGSSDDDVWFQFIATNTYHNVALQGVTAGATLNFAVYSGSCGVLTLNQCYTNNTGAVNGLIDGQTYYIRVWSTASTPQTANFTLCVTTQSTCDNASNACVNTVYTNTTGVANLGTIGCLNTAPNPRFFIVEIVASGPVNYFLQQSSPGSATPNLDVDYAAWGPFANEDVMCNGVPLPTAPLTGQTTGCSYSAAPTETFNIPNAQAGQFYVILITNFSNQPGIITLTQTNATAPGAGSTACCPEAGFTYPQNAYCITDPNPTPTILAGNLPGVFTALPAGLVFADAATGQINLAASAPGVYVVRNTLIADDSCDERHYDFTITISVPVSATISYPNPATFCSNDTNVVNVNFTGVVGGTYSASPFGLFINPLTGAVTPGQSSPGVYTVAYNILSAGACAASQPTTQIEIIATPAIAPITDVNVCGDYILPTLAVGNYFSGPGGTGTAYSANDAISSNMTMYVYASTNGCTDEESFDIVVNPTPVLAPVSNITSCTNYILPTLTVGDYYTGPGGTGTVLADGAEITTNQTIYVYAANGTCSSELSFTVTFGALTADVLNDVTVCDSYLLAPLSANNAYWTGPNGTGTQLQPNTSVSTSQTIYIWASSGTCTDESNFIVTVNQTPVIQPIANVTACDSYALPALAVGTYYDAPGGTGNVLTGNITTNQTIYVYAQTGTAPDICTAEVSFQVVINTSPVVDILNDVTDCESFTLPVLTSGSYYTQGGGQGTQLLAGAQITTTQTIYIWAASGDCSDESDFVVSITGTPSFTIESGCQGSQYVLSVVSTGGADLDGATYTWSAGGSGTIAGTGQSVVVSGADTYTVNVDVGGCDTSESLAVLGTGCLVQKGISPNGDGMNDYFDLEGQGVTRLQIFNRYGIVVYKKDNYANQWYGQADNGEELPDGTYYYVIDRAAGEAKTGWIYINRERN